MNRKGLKDQSQPFTSESYNISMQINNREDLPINERWKSVSHITELSRKFIFSLFDLVGSECLTDSHTTEVEDEFSNIVDLLFRRFNLEQFDNNGSLENAIEDYIKKLEEYNYFIPDSLVTKENDCLTPLEFNIGYKGSLECVIGYVKKILRSLREEKIIFWRNVFRKYKRDKEAFDYESRMKLTRHKTDLDWISEVDIEDYKK